MKSPRRTVELRQVNYQALLRQVYLNGPMSRLELSRQTNLSPGTVTNITSDMFEDGVLIEKGTEESLGGRPRAILEINPEYGYLVGIDIGETHVNLELFDLTRHKLGASYEIISAGTSTPGKYVQVIANNIDKLVATSGVQRERILGVGIGAPGIVEHNGQVRVAAPMWGWESVPLLEMIEGKINLPVYIDNGAKAMALAESWFGAGRGVQNMVVILIGTGVGAGIITQGTLYRGATNSAGEWGHTKIVLDGRPCRCGSQGCLEAYIGAPGIITSMHEFTNDLTPGAEEYQLSTLKQVVQAYKNADPSSIKVFQSTARLLGAGIANLVNLFNPELIVIGGWAGSMIGEIILDDVIRYVKEYSLPLSTTSLKIGLCQFGQDAICTGAACLVLDEFLSLNQKFTAKD